MSMHQRIVAARRRRPETLSMTSAALDFLPPWADTGSMTSHYRRMGAWAAGAACCFALAFVIESNVLADGLLIVGMTGLSLGGLAVQISAGLRALRTRSGVVRPMVLVSTSLCAGAIPSLFIVLGLGDLFGQFDRVRAFELGRQSASGLRLALAMTSQLGGAVAITGMLITAVVVLLQRQPRRRRVAS
jgi:hypothetical protein